MFNPAGVGNFASRGASSPAFSPIGSSNMAGAVQFWSVRDGRSVAIYPKPNHVRTITFSPNPGIFAYTEYGGRVTVSFAQFLQ